MQGREENYWRNGEKVLLLVVVYVYGDGGAWE